MPMKTTLPIVLLVLLSGCKAPGQDRHNLEVEVGAEAFSVGMTPLVEALVRDNVIAEDESWLQHLDADHRRLANDTLLRFYWEEGEDHRLLDHVEKRYPPIVAREWECRVYERRGHENAARDCWTGLRKFRDDGKRVVRTKAVIDVLVGEDTHYGYQKYPAPPADAEEPAENP